MMHKERVIKNLVEDLEAIDAVLENLDTNLELQALNIVAWTATWRALSDRRKRKADQLEYYLAQLATK